MYVYLGLLNFGSYAVNEPFALVVKRHLTTRDAVQAM